MGDSPPGSTVAFLPGFMQHGDSWTPVADRVRERYPSIRVDFETWTFEGRLREIARVCPPGSVVVGYSMGGRLALHAAVREPERFAALAVVGASAGIEDPDERRERRAADDSLARWMEGAPIEEVVARWEALPPFATQPPALVASQRPGRLAHDPAALARLLRSAGQGALPSLWDRLERLEQPVLAVAGELDARYAEVAQRMAALLPRGAAALVPGAGHAPQLERPEASAALLLEFFDQHFG